MFRQVDHEKGHKDQESRKDLNNFRHRYAYYGHNWPQEDGMYRSPKKIVEAMGYKYETHL